MTPQEMAEVEPRARTFMARSGVGYVVIDRSRASPALVSFALEMFDLEKIGEADSRELYRPRERPRPAERWHVRPTAKPDTTSVAQRLIPMTGAPCRGSRAALGDLSPG